MPKYTYWTTGEIEEGMKKLEKEDKKLLQQLTKNIEILKKIGEKK